MAEVLIFGSLSGTEPMENMHHTSLAVKVNDNLYVFDAGEGCGREAFLMGADLMRMKALFISHDHIDHVAGMAHLLWVPYKMTTVTDKKHLGEIDLFIPNVQVYEGVRLTMQGDNDYNYWEKEYKIIPHREQLGTIYENEDIKVTTFPSLHVPYNPDGLPGAFTYLIETQGKRIVFSGDVRTVWDTEEAIGEGVDLFLMETGHHQIPDICDFVNKHNIKQLVLTHHGRKIINDRPGAYKQLKSCKVPAEIAVDRMTIKL